MPRTKRPPAPAQKLAVAYARYSSHNQRDVSIEQQLQDIRAFAEREGYTIIHTYADHALSGFKESEKRKEFQRMIAAASTGQFQYVIAWKVDRIARNREHAAVTKGRLRKNGVKIVYARDNIPEGAAGVLLEGMLETTAEWYSANLSENVKRGMYDNARKCLANGMRGLGYRPGPDGQFIIIPEEAAIVREIFTLYDGGTPIKSIIGLLNQRGLKTTRGNPYSKTSLAKLLRNERYTGVYLFREIRIEGGMPQIIEKDLFERVQKRMDASQRRPNAKVSQFPLTGKLYCGHCGEAMTGDSGKSAHGGVYYYYTCFGKKRHLHDCHKRSVRCDMIEKYLADVICTQILTERNIQLLADAVVAEAKATEDHSILDSLKAQLAETQKQLRNINNAIAQGIFSSSTRELLLSLEADEQSLQDAIAVTSYTRSEVVDHDRVVFWLSKFKKGDRTDPLFLSRLFDTFLNAVYLYDDGRLRICINTLSEETTVTFHELSEALTGSDIEPSGRRKSLKETSGSFLLFIPSTLSIPVVAGRTPI